MTGRPSKTSRSELEKAFLTDELIKQILKGKSVKQAADALEIPYGTAINWYHGGLQKVYDDNASLREEVLGKELKTLDMLQRALWPAALNGHVRSVEVMLAVMDRRAKYLGLDAALKVDVNVQRVDDALATIHSIVAGETIAAPAPLLRAIPDSQ